MSGQVAETIGVSDGIRTCFTVVHRCRSGWNGAFFLGRSRGADIDRACQVEHAVEQGAGHHDLGAPTLIPVGAETIADDRLEAGDRHAAQ